MATLAHCISLHSLNPQIAVQIENVRKQYITEGHPAQVATERAVSDIMGQAQTQLDEVVSQINDKIASDYPELIKRQTTETVDGEEGLRKKTQPEPVGNEGQQKVSGEDNADLSEGEPAATKPSIATTQPVLTVSDFSEKAIIVKGDTKTHKDAIKALGGALWNKKHKGWIFSKKHREKVQSLVNEINGDHAGTPIESDNQTDKGMSLLEARNTLIELRTKADKQGYVADDRLLSQIDQFEKLVKELEADEQSEQITTPEPKAQQQEPAKSEPITEQITEEVKPTGSEWGANNKLVTVDRAEELRKKLREKLNGRLSAGIDPELLAMGTELAVFHIEAGARKFADFASRMISDLGDAAKPYLKAWYMGAKNWPGIDRSGMNSEAEVDNANVDDIIISKDTKPEETAKGGTKDVIPGNRSNVPERQETESEGKPERGGERSSEGRQDEGTGTVRGNEREGTERGQKGDAENDLKGDRKQRDGGLPQQPLDYRISEADAIGKGGAKTKARQNIAAIKLVKQLETEGRQATPEEQAILVKYVGWGSSELANNLFPTATMYDAAQRKYVPRYKEGWESLGKQLEELLTPEEYLQAKASTTNAHYTSPAIIKVMYDALEQMGFKGGRILEPGSGIGNFIGLLPDNLKNSTFTAVEMDGVSAAIAKHLYPSHRILNQDYTKTKLPHNFFDVAIGNPPFADTKILSDPEYAKNRFALHDYFFAKTMDRIRPGGLMILVTSRYTMDKMNDKARAYLSKQADFLGAVRLPQTAFKENAGTEVVTDVIFLRKRLPGEQPAHKSWNELKPIKIGKEQVKINQYYAEHPEMVLGKHALEGRMFGGNEYTVKPKRGVNIETAFQEAVKNLPENIYAKETVTTPTGEEAAKIEFSPDHLKEGAYFLNEKGEVMINQDGAGVPFKGFAKDKERIKLFIPLREAVREVLHVQLNDGSDAELRDAQEKMREEHKAFIKKFGPISMESRSTRVNSKTGKTITTVRTPNLTPLTKSDPDAYRVASIEDYDSDTGEWKERDIFTKRVVRPHVEPQIESIIDALNVTLANTGEVNISEIARLMDMPEEDIIAGLGPAVYLDPNSQRWVTNDEYLSGNVKEKLEQARAAADIDPKFKRNVEALEKVQPEDLPPSKTPIKLGMPLIRPADVEDFAREVLDAEIGVDHSSLTGIWNVNVLAGGTSAASVEWGTTARPGTDLLTAALNSSPVKVMMKVPDGKGAMRLDKEATAAANAKKEQLERKFSSWIWEKDDRAKYYTRAYNDAYNVFVKQTYDSDFIKSMTFPGVSAAINPYDHQKRVAWRIIKNGNTYMAHSVGAGKTFASILAGMEMKRLGIKKKPMWVVPNHMLKQFASEFLEAYPTAKILVADEQQFSKGKRNTFMGKVATGNWDGIIITHSAFGKIPLGGAFQEQLIREQLDELEDALRESRGDRLKRKQLEAAKKKLQEQLKAILADAGKDKGVTFEESGIDQLFVDEAHEFRKLMFATSQGDLKGIDPSGSKRAFDLFAKGQYLESVYPGRSMVFMSGTPITNTLGEVYTIQRFLQMPLLRKHGLHRFDAWASMFGSMVTKPEATPAGNYKAVSRFAKFTNLEALSAMWGNIGDFVHAKDLAYITRPQVKGGSRQLVVAPETPVLKAYKEHLAERIRRIENRHSKVEKGDDIILSVITDGRHAALDDRFIDPSLPPNPDGKLEQMIDKVFEIWKRTKNDKSTQMIFADEGLPQALETRGFSPYLRIKERLIELGVPEEEIAFMQDFKKSDEKRKLFNRMNTGQVRVLIGSSKAMGTGVNAQKLLVALHHLDPDTYLPAMIEQREGRIIRQGNTNKQVEIYAYVTKGSMDETMWQFLETKQRFIDEFLSGNAAISETDDIDKASDSYALAKAMSSTNPLVLEKAGLEADIMRLESLRKAHLDGKHYMMREKIESQKRIPQTKEMIADLEKAIAKAQSTKGDKFTMTVNGKEYKERKKAGEAIKAALKKTFKLNKDQVIDLGTFAGFPLRIDVNVLGYGGDQLNIAYLTLGNEGKFNVYRNRFKGDRTTNTVEVDALGLTMTLENSVRRLNTRLEQQQALIETYKKKIADADARMDDKFAHEDDLNEKLARLKAIDEELSRSETATSEGEEAASPSTNEAHFLPRKPNTSNKGGVKYSTPKPTESSRELQRQIEEYTGETYSPDSYQEVKVSDDYAKVSKRIGRAFGKRIVYFKTTGTEALDFNGVIFENDPNTLYVNVDGDHHVLTIAGHELLHSMRQTAPDLYRKLLKAAVGEMWADEFAKQHLKLAEARAREGKEAPTKQMTYEEMIADFVGDNFADINFWNKIALRNPTAFEKIVQFVNKFLTKVLNKMKLNGLGSSIYFRDVKKVQDAAAEVLSDFMQVQKGEVSATEYGQQWGFDVTPKMRDAAMQGQALFSPRKKATPSSEINPKDDKGNVPGDEQGKKANAIVDTVTSGPDTARDIEQDRLFTMKIFEYRDLAQKKANNIAVQIEQQIQRMAGSTRKWKGPLAYSRLKDSAKARQLSEAMMVYRDLKRDPSAEQTFRDWAKEQLNSGTLGKVETRKLREKVAILDLASNLSQEQRDFVDNDIDKLFKAVGKRAQATGLVNNLLDNYVRRLWTLPDKEKFTGLANGYGFKVWTSASKQRTLNTILDGWMAGYDLKVKGIHNSYDQIAREIAGIEANLAFIISGKKTKDLDGHSLFTTSNLDGYKELKAPGFGVWVASGKVAGPPLATDEDGNLTDDSYLLEVNTFGQKVFVAPPDGKNESTVYEKRQLKAPEQLADMINKVTATDDFFNSVPFLDKTSKFNRVTKGWILLSSFFHHLAGSRSWVFGVHHGTKINPVTAYKRGLKKIEGMHPIVQLGIKNGLTYGLQQDFDEAYSTEDTVFEQIFKRLDMDKALKSAEWVKQKRISFTNSLFKRFFAGLKAEAFVVEFTHELNKDKSQDQDRLAERIATLINADFGGLHLKRMGRNPTLQGFVRLLLLGPDWSESNFRTVTGTIPGMNKAISKLMGELPPPPGMDKVYRHFWGRVIFASVVSTLIPQLLLNAWTPDDRDDLLDFYREQFSSWEQFRQLRWTAVDITKIYRLLGVDIPDNQRKTFSIVGHFADPLKLLDFDRLIKAKGSPVVRIADNLLSGTDWAKRPFTGVKELIKTHKTVKKSRYQKTENVLNRLPSAIIGSAKGVLPIQANELLSYLMGEQDGWSALFTSAGAHPSNTYIPDVVGNRYKELRSNVLRVEREAKALRLGKDRAGAKKLIIKEFGSLANFYALKHLYVVTRTGLTPLNKRLKVLREGKQIPRRAERIEKIKAKIARKQQKFIDRYKKTQ